VRREKNDTGKKKPIPLIAFFSFSGKKQGGRRGRNENKFSYTVKK